MHHLILTKNATNSIRVSPLMLKSPFEITVLIFDTFDNNLVMKNGEKKMKMNTVTTALIKFRKAMR